MHSISLIHSVGCIPWSQQEYYSGTQVIEDVLSRQDYHNILIVVYDICCLDNATKISFVYTGGANEDLNLALSLTYQLNEYTSR